MGENAPDTSERDGTVAKYRTAIKALVTELKRRELVSRIGDSGDVLVINQAAEPDQGNPHARLLSPGFRQQVVCRPHGPGGELWWFWAWPGVTRDSPPELEPLCAAAETETAAARIAHVLALSFDGDTGGEFRERA